MNHMATCFKKYATFSGRASRAEYWTFYLINVLIINILILGAAFISGVQLFGSGATLTAATATGDMGAGHAIADQLSMVMASLVYFIPAIIYSLVIIIPTLAVSVRRLHDGGFSGALMFLSLVPLANIVPFIMFFFASQPGENQYGPNPYGQ